MPRRVTPRHVAPRHPAPPRPTPRRAVQTPLMSTKYHDAYLTGGCWSPTRPGVFYLIRKDGMLSVWDYNLQQYVSIYCTFTIKF